MIEAALALELRLSSPEKAFSLQNYLTKCGIGICGSCVDKKGMRTCVNGL
jgi:dihydroorotate dehydrogenase (NAD+) catalytic subunit